MVRLLLVGVSTRAAAESAARAGFDVTAIDAFGDADQHPGVRAIAVPGRFTPRAVLCAAARVAADAVAYLSPFENHPAVVGELARGRVLLGNTAEALVVARRPMVAGDTSPVARHTWNVASTRSLVKPVKSGGGVGVRFLEPGERVPRGSYVQPFIAGEPWSIAFVAAGGRAVPLGITRQLIGHQAFGVSGFRYCGSIVQACDPRVREQAAALATAWTREFPLVGLNGIDFIDHRGEVAPIEINPRWSSSMEVIERVSGTPVFGLHAAACITGELPPIAAPVAGASGKAIVFARHAATIRDNRAWIADPDVRDVPCSGQRIGRGHPVCTVFAAAADGSACETALAVKAAAIYRQLEDWRRTAA